MSASPCSHLASIQILEGPDEVDGCEACLAEGTQWVHLRMCMTCGEVGCCDDSPQQHARKHAVSAEHPVVRSVEQRESWSYCFVDEVVFRVAGVEPIAQAAQPHSFNHDELGTRIEMWVGDEPVGWLQYTPVGDAIEITRTEVHDGFQGMGYDGELVLEAIDIFAAKEKPLIPSDEFARAFITYRPELHGSVAPSMRGRMLGEERD
ncbi:MAG: Na+/H+ antiporter [Thermoleophilia bacterium]|nr:Na+/H+ antiporter [Thermoleophilia bacterium]